MGMTPSDWGRDASHIQKSWGRKGESSLQVTINRVEWPIKRKEKGDARQSSKEANQVVALPLL
jgi:hypothetical protein